MRRIASVLILALVAPSTNALAGPLGDAAARAGRDLAARQAPAPARNPYKMGSIALMGGGAALLVIGLLQERGAEVGTNFSGTSITVTEKGGSKTALIALGASAIGGGVALYAWGENKKVRPQLRGDRSGLSLSAAIRF